jgi:DNA-binding transcriptional ArsR family regulator
MIEQLFGSKSRYAVLRFFFRNPEAPFYVREITRALGTHINAVRRELDILTKIGIVTESKQGKKSSDRTRRKYFQLNASSMLYPELAALLLKDSLISEQTFLEQLRKKAGVLKLLLVTGVFTGDTKALTDLFFVGKVKERTVERAIAVYEKDCDFSIRYTIMTEQEFQDRRQVMDKFLFQLFEGKHVLLVDNIGH